MERAIQLNIGRVLRSFQEALMSAFSKYFVLYNFFDTDLLLHDAADDEPDPLLQNPETSGALLFD